MARSPSHAPFAADVAVIVLASNMLVQFLVQTELQGVVLVDLLIWRPFTDLSAFLVTGFANCWLGPAIAR
jgi:hypothetical protein